MASRIDTLGDRLARRLPWAAALVLGLGTLPVLRALRTPDLNWCYPYLSGDSYDWINNGMFWAGEAVLPSFRPPGLPLLIALLYRLGALSWLPVANFAALGAVAALLYRFLRRRHDPAIATFCAVVFYMNDLSQDWTRWIGAELYATLAIVIAMLLFERAGEEPRRYVPFGLAIGLGFLVHYVAAPAALGFAAAVLAFRRPHLRRRELWIGAFLAAAPPAAWLAFRWWHTHVLPFDPETGHGVESLFHFTTGNLVFYFFTIPAVLGLLLLPLYGGGAARLAARPGVLRDSQVQAYLLPLVSLTGFWVFLYDWVDRRFVLYLFPFLLPLLAEGLEAVRTYGRRGAAPRLLATVPVLAAFCWNGIRYPPYGIGYLAVTPKLFVRFPEAGQKAAGQKFGLEGANIVRLHATYLGAFARGLFDVRVRQRPCDLGDRAALLWLRDRLDRVLPPGAPIGFHQPPGYPRDYWSNLNRTSNVLLRPVIASWKASWVFAPIPVPENLLVIEAGTWRVARLK